MSAAVVGAVAVHPHVQRRVLRVGEAAVGLVQLHRGDAEVEQDAVDRGHVELVEDARQFVVHGVHERGAIGVRRQPLAGQAQRGRVTVEPDQPGLGAALQERLGVSAEPEGGVDEDGTGLLQRRGEEGDDPVEHDGDVAVGRRGIGHGVSHPFRSRSAPSISTLP